MSKQVRIVGEVVEATVADCSTQPMQHVKKLVVRLLVASLAVHS